jgi:hypothetical protein
MIGGKADSLNEEICKAADAEKLYVNDDLRHQSDLSIFFDLNES